MFTLHFVEVLFQVRFLKVVFATIIFSFIISIVYSIIGHTPVAERKPVAPVMKIILSVVIAVSTMSIGLFFINKSDETNNIYLIPEGYEGEVYVFYNVKGAAKVETEDGYEVHKINEEGYFVTSEPDMNYGTVTDKYYYVDERENRTPISDQCVSIFGTGGYTTFMDDQAFDFVYTGFKLTQDHCSHEFMLENHGMGEGEGNIIRKILEDYYDIEQ